MAQAVMSIAAVCVLAAQQGSVNVSLTQLITVRLCIIFSLSWKFGKGSTILAELSVLLLQGKLSAAVR